MKPVQIVPRRFAALFLGTAFLGVALFSSVPAPRLYAQAGAPSAEPGPAAPQSDPAASLAEALTAACRQDASAFAPHLTAENSAAFLGLPPTQRIDVLKRFVLLDDPGKPLLSTNAEGHTEIRCEASGVISELRFGAAQVRDNLAFISVEVPQAGVPTEASEPGGSDKTQSVRFGLVREGREWKLLSMGLLMLDIPTLARQWAATEADAQVEAEESAAIASLHGIADALEAYRQAYGKLPDALDQLGPPAADGASPDKAGLLDTQLASGNSASYKFRYNIVPSADSGDEADRDKTTGFELAATPAEYGKNARRSFYLDSKGTLRGADKHGAVATAEDPRIPDSPAQNQP